MSELRPPLWQDLKPAELFSALASPPDRYRPVPWLAMTGSLDWPMVEHSLREMCDKGITEFFLFPIYGMEIPYMSAAYWDLVEQMLEFCRTAGIKCWIYDEYNWPSGICAGEVIRDYPECGEKHLCLRVAANVQVELPEGAEAFCQDGGVVWAVVPFSRATLITRGSDWSNGMPGYLDVLSMGGTQRFIESTHDRYHSRFPAAFPEVLPGFFTDEPGMHAGRGTTEAGWLQLPYTDDLFESFRTRYGYDLRERLKDMFLDSETSRQTRCHYWRWVAERFGEAYGGQLRTWCDTHGVSLTGHCLGEESLLGHVCFSGDLWEAMRRFTIPGIDLLANADGFTFPYRVGFYSSKEKRGFHLTCKTVHSIVRHSGGREMMSEAYGVCDWGMNLLRQKCGFNYQVALGVTLFNDNSLITSIADFRKWAIAGKHFTQPWWQYYRQYADYNARLAALHAEGEPVAEIAVLYPRSTIWARCGASPEESLEPLQLLIYDLLDELIREQWHFDFIFEPVLAAARTEEQELVTEHARYKALIVPSATDIPQACMNVITEFARSGGVLLFSGDLPEREVDSQADLASQVEEILTSRGIQHIDADGKAVCRALKVQLQRPFALGGEGAREFVSSWRKLAGNDVLFIANMAEVALDIDVKLNLEGPFMVCDPDTLQYYRPELRDGRRFRWHFEPWQAFLILVGETARITNDVLPPAPPWLSAELVDILDSAWEFSVEPGNMLCLDMQVRPDPDNCGTADRWHRDAGETGWIKTVDGRQLREPLLPQDTPWYWLRASVECETPEGPHFIVCDNPDFLEVYVNGRAAKQVSHRPLWAEENVWFDVRGLFRKGHNTVCVRAKTSKYNDPRIGPFSVPAKLLQPVVLAGDFLVHEGNRLAPGKGTIRVDKPWEQQGLPHFAGTGRCRSTVDWDGRGRLLLHLPACTDVVEVFVNGNSCGLCTWPPYVFDLTPHASRGANRLRIDICNTLGNIITETYAGVAPTERPVSGLLQPPRLLRTD